MNLRYLEGGTERIFLKENMTTKRGRKTMNRKRMAITLAVVVLSLSLTGLAFAQGTLNVYSIWPESFAVPMFEAFTAETGIGVNFIRHSSGEVLARLIAEKNNPRVDMVFGGPADTFAAMVEEGLLEPYYPEGYEAIPEQYRDKEGYWFGMAQNPLVFLSNRQFLEENGLEPPRSWFDFLDPVYHQQLQTADARTSGTAVSRIMSLIYAFGDEDAAFDYMRQLRDSVQIYTKSGGGGTVPVALQQAGAGIFFIVDSIATQEKGYDVVISFPKEGSASAVEASGLVKGGKQPELAKKMLDWLVTAEAQSVYAQSGIGFLPTHPSAVVTPLVDLTDANLFMVDLDWAGANRQRLVERWIDEVIQGEEF
jgi:iron(III) transport system substrate-binding protein